MRDASGFETVGVFQMDLCLDSLLATGPEGLGFLPFFLWYGSTMVSLVNIHYWAEASKRLRAKVSPNINE